MGWFGYGLFDGDGTYTEQLNLLKMAKIKKTYDKYGEHYPAIQLLDDDKKLFKKSINIIIDNIKIKKKYPDLYDIEGAGISFQMLGYLIMSNKIKMPAKVKKEIIKYNDLLLGDHSAEFDEPEKRRSTIRQFRKKIEKY